MIQYILAIIFLFVISFIDLKSHEVPSIITTMFIIAELVIVGSGGIFIGLLFFLLAMLMIDYDWFNGGADIKVMGAIGIVMPNLFVAMVYFLLFLIIGTGYKFIIKRYNPKQKETAFIPVFTISFLLLIFLLVIGGFL